MTSDNHLLSEEMLNAFVDGDLDSCDYMEILTLSQQHQSVAQRLAEIQTNKRLVRQAYQHIPQPRVSHPVSHGHSLQRIAAMVLVTLLASGSGWVAGKYQGAKETAVRYAYLENITKDAAAVAVDAETQRIVLHLTSADPEKMQASLDQAELILAGSEFNAHPAHVEIVANGPGLALFRADTSPFAKRIAELQANYPSLTLIACARAIQQLQQQGIEVDIIPGVDTGSTATERIHTRSQQGWEYEPV